MTSSVVGLSDEALLDAVRELEIRRRKLDTEQHALLNELDARGLGIARGYRTSAAFLVELLRITRGEARARMSAAEAIGPRRGLSGEPLEPIFPLVAAAQADGAISAQHARIVVSTVERLPDAVQAEHEGQVEADLVDLARRFDPAALNRAATRIVDHLDPDGLLRDVEYRHRQRGLRLHRRSDGSARLEGDLDVECAEALQTVLTSLAAPRPEHDSRTTEQRHHDALLDACHVLLRSGQLPASNGVATTMIVTVMQGALETGRGVATTGTGALIPVGEAKRWATADTRFGTVALDRMMRPIGYSTAGRLFTEGQRLAMIARDQGCSLPGCTVPPALCQAHHVTEWVAGGKTSVANGALLCGYHHRRFAELGWTCRMRAGVPYWLAPPWLDPAQVPVRNTAHGVPEVFRADRRAS